MMNQTCIECGINAAICKGMCQRCYSRINSAKYTARAKKWAKENPGKRQINLARHNKKIGKIPMSKNKECTLYLGCHIAEKVLKHVFKNVEHYPYNNPGFDFVCGKGYKVDVKSSCLCYRENSSPNWNFEIDKNKIADYFLCLAFDDRENLNPMHLWLIPSDDVNNQNMISSSINTISKWDKYVLKIDKVSNCCDVMRGHTNEKIT